MKITDLHINGFGIWSELSVSDISENVTLLFGRNEAGKTTLLQFIRSIFYGFTPERIERYLPPLHGGLAGGAIYIATSQGNLEIQRHHRPDSDTPELGLPALTDEDGKVHGQEMLSQILCDVDESIFRNVFAVGLREIQHLGTLNDTEAAEHLYNLTSGLDRVSLAEVLEQLNTSRCEILAPDNQPSEIARLYDEHERLESKIEALDGSGKRWLKLGRQQQSLDRQTAELENQIKRLETESQYVEIALRITDPWKERLTIEQQLTSMGIPANVDGSTFDRLDEVNSEIERRRRQYKNIKQKQKDLRKDADSLPINRGLFANVARIEACGEHLQWIPSLERQIGHLETEVKSLDGQLESACHAAGIPFENSSQTWPEFNFSTRDMLAGPAENLRNATDELQVAITERDQFDKEAHQRASRLNRTMAQHNHEDLTEALETAGSKVSQIRRRIQIDERLEKLERTRNELDCDIDDLLEEQVLPIRHLIGIGVPFVVGVMLVLVGFFWTSSAVFGWPLAILGFVGLGIAVVIKRSMEGRIARDLESSTRQLGRVRDELDQTIKERDELDATLQGGEGPLDIQLRNAEKDLERIEEILPMESQRHDADQRNELAQQSVIKLTEQADRARDRWNSALRSAGLPSESTPQNAFDLIESYEQVGEIWKRRQSRHEELELRQQEFEAIRSRIDQVSHDAGVETSHQDPKSQLRFLLNSAADQKHVMTQREELVEKHNRFTSRRKRCLKRIKQIESQRKEVLAAAGVTNDVEFRQLVEQNERVGQLRSEHARITKQIAGAIGENGRQTEIEQLLKEFDAAALERCWENIAVEIESSRSTLADTHQKRGEITQELRELSGDRQLEETRFEASCVQQQLKDSVRRWQTLSVVSLLVEEIQKKYETERQPETLRKASAYLNQMTRGKYTRISTPLGETLLRITDSDGKQLPVEVLSRGTREAIYLSLRLALVAIYAKRNTAVPLILDDVLVNFDVDRAKATAETLRDFAETGHQLIVFTCHEHIRNLFKAAGAEIRNLPDHTERENSADVEQEVRDSDETQIDYWEDEKRSPANDSWIEKDLVVNESDRDDDVYDDDEAVDESSVEKQRATLPHSAFDSPQVWWDNTAEQTF